MLRTLRQLLEPDVKLSEEQAKLRVTGITSDSREVRPGFLFAALPGTKVDGSVFLSQAFASGAVAAITSAGTAFDNGPTFAVANPRQLFSRAASRFYSQQPELAVAVTGTNGKTSVASFTREIWQEMGFRAASIGTIGVVGPQGATYLGHTTPDPVHLHQALEALAGDHVKHLVMEASSHGLAQYRLDGVRLSAAAFTNLTRDHLDYHPTIEDYFDAKMRLFEELLPKGAPAIINGEGPFADRVVERSRAAGLRVHTVGQGGSLLNLVSVRREGFGQQIVVRAPSQKHEIYLPLVGAFQLSNALVAAGLVLATGGEESLALHALEMLKGAKGRLELVGKAGSGAPVFVDYAHTPDALVNALQALRPYVDGRLIVVFGAGGDRDPGKRPLMGEAASQNADVLIVTDDNPRTEDPALIRAAVLAGASNGLEIGGRAEAIASAAKMLQQGDVLLVAGKGHEEGQTIGRETIPFSDHEAVLAALRGDIYRG